MKHIVTTAFLSVLLVCGAGSCLGRTWIVDQGGAGDFLWVKEALTAAGAGDTILINPGDYDEYDGPDEWFTIREKPLTMMGKGSGPEDTALRLAVHFRHAGGECRVENLLFYGEHNSLGADDDLVVRNCRFEENASLGGGAALYTTGSVLVEDCVFINNWAYGTIYEEDRGGAIRASGTQSDYLTVRRSLFIGNEAAYQGGAICATEPVIEDCVFYRNKADRGAALMADYCSIVRGCTFFENEVLNGPGAAVETCNNGIDLFSHCIVARTINGYGLACMGLVLECCDVWMNEWGDFWGMWCQFSESMGNFSADPLFCDEATGDIGLREGSPCLPGPHGPVQCNRIGARGLGCTGPIRVERLSWGKIRALYR